MIKMKFSDSYEAKKKRIQRLPILVEGYADNFSQKNANSLIENFQDGLRKNSFKLPPLKPETVRRKTAQGLPKPRVPLYGQGDQEDEKSYINMLRIRKLKNGYRVYPSWAKHHSGDIELRTLFWIHEKGAVIRQMRGGKIVVIRIPPRPAFRKAYLRTLRQIRQRETSKDVRRAITRLINTGDKSGLVRLIR